MIGENCLCFIGSGLPGLPLLETSLDTLCRKRLSCTYRMRGLELERFLEPEDIPYVGELLAHLESGRAQSLEQALALLRRS